MQKHQINSTGSIRRLLYDRPSHSRTSTTHESHGQQNYSWDLPTIASTTASTTISKSLMKKSSSMLSTSQSSGNLRNSSTLQSSRHDNYKMMLQPSRSNLTPFQAKQKQPTVSPQEYLDLFLYERGYSTNKYSVLESGYYNEPTSYQINSYHNYLLQLIKQDDVPKIRELFQSQCISNNPSTPSGNTILHFVCYVNKVHVLKALLELGTDVRVSDNEGNTPLHEACGKSKPCFELIECIIQQDPRMLHMTNMEGDTPLACIPKQIYNNKWIPFIDNIKDRYWPPRNSCNEQPPPPLTFVKPNSRPVPDPAVPIKDETLIQLASGIMKPSHLVASIKEHRKRTTTTSHKQHDKFSNINSKSSVEDSTFSTEDETIDTRDMLTGTSKSRRCSLNSHSTSASSNHTGRATVHISGIDFIGIQTKSPRTLYDLDELVESDDNDEDDIEKDDDDDLSVILKRELEKQRKQAEEKKKKMVKQQVQIIFDGSEFKPSSSDNEFIAPLFIKQKKKKNTYDLDDDNNNNNDDSDSVSTMSLSPVTKAMKRMEQRQKVITMPRNLSAPNL